MDIVALNWLELSSALLIATISPVPIIEPVFAVVFELGFPPELPPELLDSAAFATELVVPPFPPDLLSVGVVVGSLFGSAVPFPPPEPPELPPFPPEFPVFPPEFPVFSPF
jgi:hypothetical protein